MQPPRSIKRIIDLIIVIPACVLLFPLILIIAAVVKASSRGPAFYCQERIGRSGVPFQMWKIRTMLLESEDIIKDYISKHPEIEHEWEVKRKLENGPRIIPRIGKFLRKSSLDELPQLWNVLRGEMSLVGPRPLPQYHLDQFDPQFRSYRQQAMPGLTGLWQVVSRTNGDPEMFVKWDSYYIQRWSPCLDFVILLRTFKVVFPGNGV